MENYVEFPIEVRFRDTDSLGHVNNAVYLTYLEIARTKWYLSASSDLSNLNFIVARIEIDYIKPITLLSKIAVRLSIPKIGNKSWEFQYEIIDKKDNSVYAKAKSVQVSYDYKENKSITIPNEVRILLEKLMS